MNITNQKDIALQSVNIDLSIYDEAMERHGSRVRADSAGRHGYDRLVATQRAVIATFAERQVHQAALRSGKRSDSAQARSRISHLMLALAGSVGLVRQDGQWGSRYDAASYFPGELVDPGSVYRRTDNPRVLQTVIPARAVDPARQMYMHRMIGYEGKAEVATPGMTEFPNAGFTAQSKLRQLHTFVTSVTLDWERLVWGRGDSDIDDAAENAEAATRTLLDLYEQKLVTGITGLDMDSLANLELSYQKLSGDYREASSITIGQAYSQITAAIQNLAKDQGYRGQRPNALILAPIVADKLRTLNNLDAGGGANGAEVFSGLFSAQQGAAMRSAGITAVYEAPALNKSPRAADSALGILAILPQEGGLKRVVAAMPAPVRTISGAGETTIWAMRAGGLECPIATSTGLIDFRVR